MARVRAADDFEAIRSRLEELRRERAQLVSPDFSHSVADWV
jgi:hypothetical protein